MIHIKNKDEQLLPLLIIAIGFGRVAVRIAVRILPEKQAILGLIESNTVIIFLRARI